MKFIKLNDIDGHVLILIWQQNNKNISKNNNDEETKLQKTQKDMHFPVICLRKIQTTELEKFYIILKDI